NRGKGNSPGSTVRSLVRQHILEIERALQPFQVYLAVPYLRQGKRGDEQCCRDECRGPCQHKRGENRIVHVGRPLISTSRSAAPITAFSASALWKAVNRITDPREN